jgi:hypothetical protein
MLDLANPSAGDVLSAGDYLVSGVARDAGATSGDGIDRVELFVGDRDAGGTEVGVGVPRQGQFQVTAKLPTNVSGETSFFAYARSAITGQETKLSVPVFLGAAPTPTPRPTGGAAPTPLVPAVAQVSCAAATTSPAADTSAPTLASGPNIALAAVAPSVAPVLQVANPNAGDTLLQGYYVISGLAYVPNASQGSGVDRVAFFLGDRDTGGVFLGSAVPDQSAELNATPGSLLATAGFATKVSVPSQIRGSSTFFAYARNSITGQETVTSVPVFVGAGPTPTPRPSSS